MSISEYLLIKVIYKKILCLDNLLKKPDVGSQGFSFFFRKSDEKYDVTKNTFITILTIFLHYIFIIAAKFSYLHVYFALHLYWFFTKISQLHVYLALHVY